MTRQDLITKLTTLPGDIRDAEESILDATRAVQRARSAHGATVAALYVNELLTGKNKETRDAQEFDATVEVRAILTEAENALAVKRANLAHLRDEFSALRAIAALLGPETTP